MWERAPCYRELWIARESEHDRNLINPYKHWILSLLMDHVEILIMPAFHSFISCLPMYRPDRLHLSSLYKLIIHYHVHGMVNSDRVAIIYCFALDWSIVCETRWSGIHNQVVGPGDELLLCYQSRLTLQKGKHLVTRLYLNNRILSVAERILDYLTASLLPLYLLWSTMCSLYGYFHYCYGN